MDTHRRIATRPTLCESCSGLIQQGEAYLVHAAVDHEAVHVQRAECGFCAIKFGRRQAMFPPGT